MDTNVTCPFCGETGFDLLGLKNHLHHDCEAYAGVEELPRLFSIKRSEHA